VGHTNPTAGKKKEEKKNNQNQIKKKGKEKSILIPSKQAIAR